LTIKKCCEGSIDAALDILGLADLADLPAAYLSAGQRRRLSLARLAAVPRPIWLLDEPTAALDASAQARVADLMHTHLSGGGIIVAAVHGAIGTLVPFAVGPDLALLARIGPAILWLGALLASLLALDHLFAADQTDGSLDVILTARVPLELAVLAKAVAHWITTGLPLVVAAPLLGVMLNIEGKATAAVTLTLAAGTPALTLIGIVGAALAVALRRGGLLLPVLVLPLTVPVLIFGVAAANAAIVGPVPFGIPFTILCALSLASLAIGPFAAAAALRHGLE
jgi:heme exporter protein B